MKSIFGALVLVWMITTSFGQSPLPRYLTGEEVLKMDQYLEERSGFQSGLIEHPPTSPVRSMAEWEELDAIAIAWTSFPNILSEITRYAQEECGVIIICQDSNQVKTDLQNRGIIPNDNVQYIVRNLNSIWIRDYGPNTVYSNDVDSLFLIDWIYDRPRQWDDGLPGAIGEFLDVPVYSTTNQPWDLVATGGNYMSDGLGLAFSSDLILEENGFNNIWGMSQHTESDVDAIMKAFMGTETYVKMPALPFDVIHHIDMHMKLINERTILVGAYPQGIADGPQIEANVQYVLNEFQTTAGHTFDIIRIPMPPDQFNRYPDGFGYYRTFTNAMFVNKTVLVPVYEPQYDTTALRVWNEMMPGYNIQGINCNAIIPSLGALHCIIKEVGSKDPLWISHEPLADQFNGDQGYSIEAKIKHRSGIAQASVYHTDDVQNDYDRLDMTLVDTQNDTWAVEIPEYAEGSRVHYYLSAEAQSGKNQVRPLPAPDSFFSFDVELSSSVSSAYAPELGAIFPNPSRAITAIPVSGFPKVPIHIRLVNALGQVVKVVYNGIHDPHRTHYFLDASTLNPGIHHLVLETDAHLFSQKVIIH